jgi:predicted transcriptional regulator
LHTKKVNHIPLETFIKIYDEQNKMVKYDPDKLMKELLNKDRFKYMEKILELGGNAKSIDITKAILTPRGITEDRRVKKENIMVNKRLTKLASLGILKVEDAKYSISSLGYLLLDSWKELNEKVETLKKFQKFFDTHFVGNLPQEFFRQIYKLKKTKLTESSVGWMEELNKQTKETRRKLYVLTDLIHSIPEDVISKKKNGKIEEIVIIYEFNNYPKLNLLRPNEKELFDKLVDAGAEFRYIMLENIRPIGLRIVDEKWATFGLTRIADGVLDRNNGFIGTDPDFISWCRDLMYHMWHFWAQPLETNSVTAE